MRPHVAGVVIQFVRDSGEVNGIVIHYVGNPGTTAAQNHSFFTNLAQTGETYASSHFLVGLDGEDALVTSGDYQRYYSVNGKRYAHIIDPDTLMPPEYMSSVSVLCPDSGRADALSTTLFLMPVEQGKALVESLPDVEAVWVAADGTITYSSGFEAGVL